MDKNWWMKSLGTMTNDEWEFQEYIEEAARDGKNKFIVVDFFMPACRYCVEFMPQWNQIVEEFTEKYGEQVQFVKVDGKQDR